MVRAATNISCGGTDSACTPPTAGRPWDRPIGKPQGTPAAGNEETDTARTLALASTAEFDPILRAWARNDDCRRAKTRRASIPMAHWPLALPTQMRPLLEQWKRWQEMYERGEIPDEPVLAVQPAATSEIEPGEDAECRS